MAKDKINEKKEVEKNKKDIDEEIEEVEEDESSDTKPQKKGKKIKTSDICLIVGLVLIVVVGFVVMGGESVKTTYALPLTLEGDAGLQELSYEEYQEKIDNGDTFVVIIERETCSHCQNFLPVAEEFAEDYGVPMYYIDTDTFTTDEWTSFYTSNSFIKKNSDAWGTPTTVVLVGSDALDYIEGETTADELLELYEEYFGIE